MFDLISLCFDKGRIYNRKWEQIFESIFKHEQGLKNT